MVILESLENSIRECLWWSSHCEPLTMLQERGPRPWLATRPSKAVVRSWGGSRARYLARDARSDCGLLLCWGGGSAELNRVGTFRRAKSERTHLSMSGLWRGFADRHCSSTMEKATRLIWPRLGALTQVSARAARFRSQVASQLCDAARSGEATEEKIQSKCDAVARAM